MKMAAPTSIIKQSLTDSVNIRQFLDASVRSFERLRTAGIGLGTYKPGWRWSLHAGPQSGKASENHIGYVISGHFMVRDAAGYEVSVGPGDAFELAPGSDAWVQGSEACIALDFLSYEAHSSISP